MQKVDEFQTRHATINESITSTYRIGNQLQSFIEKQIIIDYHIMGKQEKLETDYPHLIKKAKKFLGFESYFELKSQPSGVPLDNQHPLF